MKSAEHDKADSGRLAGPRLRCFLSAELMLLLVIGSSGAAVAHAAATCPAPSDLHLARLQGTVYGPSGVPLSQIQVRVEQAGKLVVQAQTDERGRFQFKVAPGDFDVHLQFLGTKTMDLNVRVGHNLGGFFHTARLRVVLGISGAKCSFATTSKKKFKDEMKRFEQRLVEMPPGP
jgi:hypothetical protein